MLSYKKIILEIPDTTSCAVISTVYRNESDDLMIVTYTAGTEELRTGETIIVPKIERGGKDIELQ